MWCFPKIIEHNSWRLRGSRHFAKVFSTWNPAPGPRRNIWEIKIVLLWNGWYASTLFGCTMHMQLQRASIVHVLKEKQSSSSVFNLVLCLNHFAMFLKFYYEKKISKMSWQSSAEINDKDIIVWWLLLGDSTVTYGQADTEIMRYEIMWKVSAHRFEQTLILPVFESHRKISNTNWMGIKK